MGYGSYKSSDWSRLRKSKKITESSSASQIFTSRHMEERFDPKFISMRESMDSEEHPNSTPVIIGLDTTGSMGYLSEEIAKNGLNETMLKIYSTNPIEDPQLMFAAVGDVTDNAPLQVTQFESDIRIAEQLFAFLLEAIKIAGSPGRLLSLTTLKVLPVIFCTFLIISSTLAPLEDPKLKSSLLLFFSIYFRAKICALARSFTWT